MRCWNKIENFHVFYENVEKKHKSFRKFVLEEDAVDIKEERNQDDESFVQDHLQIYRDSEMIIGGIETVEKNPLDSKQNQNYHDDVDFGIDYDSNTSDDYEPSENSDAEDTTSEYITKALKKENEIKRNIGRKLLNKSDGKIDVHEKRKISHRLDPKLTEQLIKKHISMLCDLCVFSGNTFADIVAHFKIHHAKVQPYIMCCNRKFTRSYCIDQHAAIHENPDSFR